MLGWHIAVYRQENGGERPAAFEEPRGERIAVWQTRLGGCRWIDRLAEQGHAIDLGGNGYPNRYTATAKHLLPVITAGPPDARERWVAGADDVLTEKWDGTTVVDSQRAAACRPDEWLLIEAWDES
jgi:hypothetical protein